MDEIAYDERRELYTQSPDYEIYEANSQICIFIYVLKGLSKNEIPYYYARKTLVDEIK